jgi:mannose-1-phosphate guanylyltransferase
MLHAIVMAGGSGTRFWPKSRRSRPKQLLCLHGDRTMLQQTVDRISPLTEASRIWIITGEDQAQSTRQQVPELSPNHVVGEPCARDTAACVGLAATLVAHEDPEGTMIVMPADHVIGPDEAFHQTVRAAIEVIEASPSTFVTFGIAPTRAETGYGYIKRGKLAGEPQGVRCYPVKRFREKPDRKTAQKYFESGKYFWNSGIFIWRAKAILAAIREFQPALAEGLDVIAKSLGTPEQSRVIEDVYAGLSKIPIDKAVMEQAEDVQVLEVRYDWNDVGDWRALAALVQPDESGNSTQGPVIASDTSGSVIVADEGHLIVVLGASDLVVVQSNGATLVAPKARMDQLKGVVESLEARGFGGLL